MEYERKALPTPSRRLKRRLSTKRKQHCGSRKGPRDIWAEGKTKVLGATRMHWADRGPRSRFPIHPRMREWPESKPTTAARPSPREPLFLPHRGHRASAQRERVAAIWLSTWCPPFDDAESRLTTDKRHVVGHYRLGESLQRERANLFGCDTSF